MQGDALKELGGTDCHTQTKEIGSASPNRNSTQDESLRDGSRILVTWVSSLFVHR